MHLSLLLTKEYINYANRFDKEVIFWYDHSYKQELMDGYQVAEEGYVNAKYYWHKTKQYARLCYQSRDMYLQGSQMAQIQDEAHKIILTDSTTPLNQENINLNHRTSYLDYRYDDILEQRLADLEKKRQDLQTGPFK